jgi:hypothetical protein
MHLIFKYAKKKNISHRYNNLTKAAMGSRLLQKLFDSSISVFRFCKPQCQQSSDNLKFLSIEKKFPAQYMFSMDESEISSIPNKSLKVIS